MKKRILAFIGGKIKKNQQKIADILKPIKASITVEVFGRSMTEQIAEQPRPEGLVFAIQKRESVVEEPCWVVGQLIKRGKRVKKLKAWIKFWRKIGDVAVRWFCTEEEQTAMRRFQSVSGNVVMYDDTPENAPEEAPERRANSIFGSHRTFAGRQFRFKVLNEPKS